MVGRDKITALESVPARISSVLPTARCRATFLRVFRITKSEPAPVEIYRDQDLSTRTAALEEIDCQQHIGGILQKLTFPILKDCFDEMTPGEVRPNATVAW